MQLNKIKMNNLRHDIDLISVSARSTTTSNIVVPTYIQAVALTAAFASSPCAFAVEGFQQFKPQVTTESFKESTLLKSQALQIKRCEFEADRYGVEPPNDAVKNEAFKFLTKLNNYSLTADFINPSHDGGIIIEFTKENVFCVLEIFNDKEVVFLIRKDNIRKAWDLNHNDYESFVISELFV
jgi:hypothetical protein